MGEGGGGAVGTITAARSIGTDTMQDYLSAFGFGHGTGLRFKGETPGLVSDEWFGADLGSNAIGQGPLVNAVQVLASFNVIANDGLYVSPVLVRSRIDDDGNEVPGPAQQTRRVIAPETAHEVTRMLTGVVENGTGVAAAIPDYTVAGKTGTAWQVFEQPDGSRGYGDETNRKYTVRFAGFMPAETLPANGATYGTSRFLLLFFCFSGTRTKVTATKFAAAPNAIKNIFAIQL